MKKTIFNLGSVLNRTKQKSINGGSPIEGNGCRCFCYIGARRVSNSCHSLCSDGSVPGVESGDSTCWASL